VKQLEQVLLLRTLNERLASPVVDISRLRCPSGYVVQPAMPRHLPALPAIEAAAESLFPAGRLGAATGSTRPDLLLHDALASGLLWVALDLADMPVGFALALDHDDLLHLQEMDVHPDHGRRGIGAALVRHVVAEAHRRGLSAVTLTTFADLPWNAPFYRHLGFEVLAADALSPGLRLILAEEAAKGLQQRVAMSRRVD
jgi:GNAT superfamily N-acetyltransferase